MDREHPMKIDFCDLILGWNHRTVDRINQFSTREFCNDKLAKNHRKLSYQNPGCCFEECESVVDRKH